MTASPDSQQGQGRVGGAARVTLRGSVLIFAAIFALLVFFEASQLPSRRQQQQGVPMEDEGQMYTEQSFRGGGARAMKEEEQMEAAVSSRYVNCSLCPLPPLPTVQQEDEEDTVSRHSEEECPKCPEISCPQPKPCPVQTACPTPVPPIQGGAEQQQQSGEPPIQEGGVIDGAGRGGVQRQEIWDDPGYHYYPYDDMFFPYNATAEGPRSLVLFTGGRSGMENVDKLVRSWGTKHFDYVIMHFDDSSSEWQKFEWYRDVVSVTAQKQAKFWYYKRFASPWSVKGYRYVHFVDSDAGSPEERPFDLRVYEEFLAENKVLIGQPAISDKGRSSDHMICRVHSDMLFRWTSVVENGPLYSVAQEAYECYWDVLSPVMVSGWGPDTAWCPYLYEVCGFPREGSCAVIDVHYIDHLDKKTASGNKYRGRDYWDYGFEEWRLYKEAVQKVLKSPYQANPTFFHNIKMVPLPPDWSPPSPPPPPPPVVPAAAAERRRRKLRR